ncbi:MAG: pilus assembly protein TadG-related protein [Novosphingobium sp.]
MCHAQRNTPIVQIFKPSFTQSLVRTVKDLLDMNTWIGTYRPLVAKLLHMWLRLRASTSGNVILLSALAMPVLVGMAGLAIEGGNWYQVKRAMQNAADSAAVAAATNAGTRYAYEAKAVSGQYGFTDGQDYATVTASNAAACPSGGSTCYSVAITKAVPLVFSRLVGFDGSSLGGRRVISLSSVAVATKASTVREYCVLALNTLGTPLRSNGAPSANLSGCNVMSNNDATCNGGDLNATYGDAYGVNSNCGDIATSNVPRVTDPYAYLAPSIPPNPCASYPQATISNNGKTVSSAGSATTISGSYSTTGNWNICGDLVLSGDVTLTGSSVLIVIYNGSLLTNGYTITTASGAAATVIFSGTSGAYSHIPNTQGTIDIKAPTTGTWKGIALYQDPNLPVSTGLNIDYSGNNPRTPVWDISGMVYMPNADVTFSGVVNKAANGNACFGLVIRTLLINGNASILAHGQCATAGLTLPSNTFTARGQLVS